MLFRSPAGLCRFLGCLVIGVVLHAELQDGLFSGSAGVIQLSAAGLTAILFGNVAKEVAFDLYARIVLWSGRTFLRTGLTLAGNTYHEMQFTDGTWIRYEIGSEGTFCEWTEADGRCNRVAVQPRQLRLPRGARHPDGH